MVVNKPAGLVCHPTKGDEFSSLISRVRLYLGAEGHLVNRLDRETSGVTVVAKNSAAAGELGKLWENRDVRKDTSPSSTARCGTIPGRLTWRWARMKAALSPSRIARAPMARRRGRSFWSSAVSGGAGGIFPCCA